MKNQLDWLEAFNLAQARMDARIAAGARHEEELLNTVAKLVIVDRLVPPKRMTFAPVPACDTARLMLNYFTDDGGGLGVTIHRHAFTQLCQKVSLPMSYANMLEGKGAWQELLLAHNLNELFHKEDWTERGGQPTRFLHRIVDGELRGFLSRRFNRHLASAPLLRSFIDACRASGAQPVESYSSPVRNALKCLLPKVFEAFPGEYICLGVEWSNSDFGSGKLKVSQTVWRVAIGSSSILDEGLSRTHIGSIIEDSDIEMSNETALKEVAAQQSAVQDHVKQYLSEKMTSRLLAALRMAHDELIPWSQLRSRLRDVLSKGDLDWMQGVIDTGESIIDLPPLSYSPSGERMPNRYWAANAISAVAAKAEDIDRKMELQREAGRLLAAALEKV